jgi:regulatory protein SWI5
MVSSSQSNRQHRRQTSTPSTLEATKVSKPPAQAVQRYHAHRRGQSLDQRPTSIQDGAFPTTNAAVQPRTFLRRAQHHQFAQQGNPPASHNSNPIPFTPHFQGFSQDQLKALANFNVGQGGSNINYVGPNVVFLGTQGVEGQPSNNAFDKLQQQHVPNSNPVCDNAIDRQFLHNGPFDIYDQSNFAEFQQQANGIPGDMRRLSAQSGVSAQSQPPRTPTHQRNPRKFNDISVGIDRMPTGQAEYHPITPATTPFNKSATNPHDEVHATPTKSRNLSEFGAADASHMQRAMSLHGVAEKTLTQPKIEMPSPPNTASFDFDSNDVFDCKQGSSFENPESSNPQNHYTSSASSSFYSTPELADMPSPGDSGGKAPKVPILPATPNRRSPSKGPSSATPSESPEKPRLSPRPASIDNLNLDDRVHASINETGVTMDEIAAFIFGPDPDDGKWVCLHPQCGRRFGRKENIKSHVQTHLGDRQYKCEHCGKCFVRGHDLKRHAKIHTGDKPYECLCGNVFARHDALTRHRQRGMCVGGYQGVVRKAVKRGRPKKHRPEMDERQTKAARTRRRAAQKPSTESVSGCSDDAPRNSPPSEIFETMSLRPNSPSLVFTTPNYSLPPDVFTFTPPASPGHNNNASVKQSPTQTYRSLTPSTEDEMPPMPSSKHRPMLEDSALPFISDDAYQYPDITTSNHSTANALSSPHTAPTLTDSTNGSDLDLFINQDAGASVDQDMASFPDYTSSLDDGMDLFHGKSWAMQPVLSDEMLRYPNDELPSEVMSKDFFMD